MRIGLVAMRAFISTSVADSDRKFRKFQVFVLNLLFGFVYVKLLWLFKNPSAKPNITYNQYDLFDYGIFIKKGEFARENLDEIQKNEKSPSKCYEISCRYLSDSNVNW